jgi:hypothetical protein
MTFFYDLNKRLADLAKKQTLAEDKGAKPDFLDMDKDGNKKEPMKKAVADKGNAKSGKMFGKKTDMDEGLGNALKNIGGNIKQGYLDNRAKAAEKAYYNQDFSSDEYAEKRGVAKQKADMYRAQRQAVAGQPAVTDSQVEEADMEEGNRFTGNLMKARAAGLKKADLDGDGDMEAVREAAKPDYIDLDKDGNRKENYEEGSCRQKEKSRCRHSI